MKCNQFIKTVTKPGKKAIVLPHRETIALERGWKLGKARICGGTIRAEIEIFDAARYTDYQDLQIKIEYVCQTCRKRYTLGTTRGLPENLEELQNFLSNEVENLE